MSRIIEDYYNLTKVMTLLLNQKMSKLQRNKDIQKEFEYWIQHKEYVQNGILIEGYTAQKLSELSAFIDGEAVFMLLIELREAPEKALRRIQNGFKIK